MAEENEFDAMADACIEAGERVMQAGSPALQAAMRIALHLLGREIAERVHDPVRAAGNGIDGTNGKG